MKRRDPIPFHQVAAFDAAARHSSFSRAAQELNVQQPAISRRVAGLETTLGTKLFLRTKPRLTLTADGELLADAIATGIEAIESGLREIRRPRSGNVVVVNAALGFTSFFLLPRLGDFQCRYPDIPIEVVTRDQNLDFDPDRCDVAVVFGESGVPGADTRPVFGEDLIPVCRPGYLKNGPVTCAQLLQHRLLHMRSPEHQGDWARYLRGTGLAVPVSQIADRFFSFTVYLRAIQNGDGIGLGWRHLVEDMVEAGSLEVACARTVRTARGYFCSVMTSSPSQSQARVFQEWLAGGSL